MQKPSFGHKIHAFLHVLPSRKLQVKTRETGIKPEDNPKNHHKNLKSTTNAEDRSFRPRKTRVSCKTSDAPFIVQNTLRRGQSGSMFGQSGLTKMGIA
jgi:hypothetical protein